MLVNLCKVFFDTYCREIFLIAKNLFVDMKEHVDMSGDSRYGLFYMYERSRILVVNTVCNILLEECERFVISSDDGIKSVKENYNIILQLLIDTHNYCVANGKDSEKLKDSVKCLNEKLANRCKFINNALFNILRSADPVHEHFPMVCVCTAIMSICVNDITQRCSSYGYSKIDCTTQKKVKIGILSVFADTTVTCDIGSEETTEYSLTYNRKVFIEKLEKECNPLIQVQIEFLLNYVERAYGAKCCFDNLLLCMADAALSNPEKKPLVKGAQIWLSNVSGFVIKPGPEKDITNNPSTYGSDMCAGGLNQHVHK